MIFSLVGCGLVHSSKRESEDPVFIPAPNSIDLFLDTASIEKYILALPTHDISMEFFENMVRNARNSLSQNRGARPDFLYIGGDGSRGIHSFSLDRNKRVLRVLETNLDSIPPRDDRYYLYRVPGGWIQTHKKLSPRQLDRIDLYPVSAYWEGVGG